MREFAVGQIRAAGRSRYSAVPHDKSKGESCLKRPIFFQGKTSEITLKQRKKTMKPYTILLVRPDCVAATFGYDTFCAHVEGQTVEAALDAARASACESDDHDTPEDYYCLFCTDGHVVNYQDGAGGVWSPKN